MFYDVRTIYMEIPEQDFSYTKAWIPVMALPKINEWISDWPSKKG